MINHTNIFSSNDMKKVGNDFLPDIVPVEQLTSRGGVAVRIRLIGQMEAWTAGNESVLPIGRKTRALLAILALSAPRPVIRARLAELLWSRRLEEQARASLRQEIHRLLEALHPAGQEIVRVSRDHLSLRPDLVWTDVDDVLRATPADPSPLALLDAEVLEEFNGLDPALDLWLAGERERLRDHARSVAEALLRAQRTSEGVISAAQQLLGIDRAHEGAWRAMMRAHAERGERGMAVKAFERCKAVLLELHEAAPSPETYRLAGEIRAGAMVMTRLPRPNQLPAESQPGPGSGESGLAKGEPNQAWTGEISVVVNPATKGWSEKPSPYRSTGGYQAGKHWAVKMGVMPLQMIGTGEAEAHLSLGLAEEMTAALARFRWMFIVSSSTLARCGHRDETVLRRVFGLDFLLDGSVQREGGRLRTTFRLLDLREGNQIVWARRFDRQVEDLPYLQDEIAAEVVAQIDPEILLIEGRRAAQRLQTDNSAYELVLRALPLIVRLRRAEFMQAGELLSRALEIDPDFAAAHAWRAFWMLFYIGQGWADQPGALEEARSHAERAITLDPQDARGLTVAGHVHAYLHRRPRDALELHGRALSLNPNLAMAWGFSAATFTYLGDADEAARRYARYKRLSPMDPNAFIFDAGMALLELTRRDYSAAILLARRSSELHPYFTAGLKHYLSALGHGGLTAEADVVKTRLLLLEPRYTVQGAIRCSPFEQAAETGHYAAGLRSAGLPEGAIVERVSGY